MSTPLLSARFSPGQVRHPLRFYEASLWQPDADSKQGYQMGTSVYSTEVDGLAAVEGELLSQYDYLSTLAADALRVRVADGPGGGHTLAYPIGVITWARAAS